ncbi:MAG TPA: (Fe-S)-binding protein [Thermodesulfobacteriota bacterium]|nr:(Fe-S)-binding protein [Deltaproteobacteria bacterium]HNR12725.1 (Fe-S)-binding protein [Thermodesulfobacteriota bacterium]HNU72172.1 (Fe-S)-binding protein [Thermodesulfobacteriota bacterium]HOC39657.1 (Fe-S)-binding protein [Thermodesulfobacteriota bacterium]HQO78724.1 (Fe-S)-binding protein [Thermodesulfobacteriota bacterium]
MWWQQSSKDNRNHIEIMFRRKQRTVKLLSSFCVRCGLCADSCFLYRNHHGDQQYMPSYEALTSMKALAKNKKLISREELENVRDLIWKKCVLCKRCYCPLGIDIPSIIAFARTICRTRGMNGVYPHSLGEPEDENIGRVE